MEVIAAAWTRLDVPIAIEHVRPHLCGFKATVTTAHPRHAFLLGHVDRDDVALEVIRLNDLGDASHCHSERLGRDAETDDNVVLTLA
jgi:hypothetical protein